MHEILGKVKVFVATTYGFDMGYYNGMTIKSSICIDVKVDALELEFEKRISEYQSRINSFEMVDDWLSAIEMLATGSAK